MEIPGNDFLKVYFRKSTHKNKKYDAMLSDGCIIPFGQTGYEHYKDSTPLRLYSNLNHDDETRRLLYRKRFAKIYKKNENNPYSSVYWSWNYLW